MATGYKLYIVGDKGEKTRVSLEKTTAFVYMFLWEN